MLPCHVFFTALQNEGIDFFAGVPDSLLKDFCAYISDNVRPANHVIAANEGAALALAAGHFLATSRLSLVYLQNSGLGNLVNPLTSLTAPEVYAIPALLLIGWRGEPGVHDEPQHRMQGRTMRATLDAMEVDHAIVPDDPDAAISALATAIARAKEVMRPYALIVRKGTFEPYKLKNRTANVYTLSREDALKFVLDSLVGNEVVVSTTGMMSREVFELREASGGGHARDFLTVGCMGHASQIAMGIAVAKPDRLVYCLDGDGALLMHMGSLAIVGSSRVGNFRHIVINNGSHDSVGGQPTAGFTIDIPAIARACGYSWVGSVDSAAEIPSSLVKLKTATGPALLEIRANKGARDNLGRPTTSTHDNKRDFMAYLQ